MIRLCDGENRLKARSGHGSLTEGKGEPRPKTEPIFLAGENYRVFEITKLIIRQTSSHGIGDASRVAPFSSIEAVETQKKSNYRVSS